MNERIFRIGKADDNDIVLFGNYISPYHAELHLFDDGRVEVCDLNSTFGVTVNGDRIVEPLTLRKTDHIKVGTHLLHWQDEINDLLYPTANPYQDFYTRDFLHARGVLNRSTFRFITILFVVSPVFIFFGVPVLLTFFSPGMDAEMWPFALQYNPILWTTLSLVVGLFYALQCVKRMRDTGYPIWHLFLPFWNLYLLLFKE